MKCKWCVCDMDGTLLNSDGLISIENESALKKLQEMGIEVIIASGRTDLMMKSYIKQLELKGHIICCNGGLVKKIETDEVIYKKLIDKETAEKVIKYCFENAVNFLVYTIDMVYSNSENQRAKYYENLNSSLSQEFRIPIDYIEYAEIDKLLEKDIFKVLIIEKDDERKDSIARHFSDVTELAVVTSAKGLLDIMASGVSKGDAIKKLSEELKIDLKEVIAFGDNYNDLEMFEAVGFPVAMENAVEDIKAHSKFITRSNDESGVAYAIDNLFLKHKQS
ncbi:Cof subfamily protein (haloacid dehalogenase superfamily) [Sedimentibacter acidaminivorans]|uniref:Cof subfamily protein (Haloacid dehalogenase superfamily) n=1 Tax=Sedimentibacter acidaminivorans TaxID=913099 RepID=A0ABS4GFR0_9FIRM|nr:Cof-type HAD-IIB family hydrolase [Sedimentibacter acidaminivorans]MBP1926525.1 Cof subfamily protein (haloacid dehalogenase superfamily) [Sedimentibacter acidaminivorans]